MCAGQLLLGVFGRCGAVVDAVVCYSATLRGLVPPTPHPPCPSGERRGLVPPTPTPNPTATDTAAATTAYARAAAARARRAKKGK